MEKLNEWKNVISKNDFKNSRSIKISKINFKMLSKDLFIKYKRKKINIQIGGMYEKID